MSTKKISITFQFGVFVKQAVVLSISTGEIVDLKILQSNWLRAFRPISQEEIFPKYRICAETANTNFHYRINPVKINDQLFL